MDGKKIFIGAISSLAIFVIVTFGCIMYNMYVESETYNKINRCYYTNNEHPKDMFYCTQRERYGIDNDPKPVVRLNQ